MVANLLGGRGEQGNIGREEEIKEREREREREREIQRFINRTIRKASDESIKVNYL